MIKQFSCLLLSLAGLIAFVAVADTVKPADIDTQYLPVDSDVDGVIDDNDECYKTPPGTTVDERGCPVVVKELNQIRLNINFDFDSSVVKSAYYAEVEKVAVFMRKHPTSRVVIEGHSDSDGAAAYNKSLSNRRAQAAAKVLVSQFGIKPVRVTAVGFGEDRPLVANDSVANKSKNRRVVAVIRTLKEKRS